MKNITALILTDGPDGANTCTPQLEALSIAGLTPVERAALAAHRAGIERIRIVGDHLPDEQALERLRKRGLTVTCSGAGSKPFALVAAAVNQTVVVVPVDTVFEPRALASLLEQSPHARDEAALAVDTRPDGKYRALDVSNGLVRSMIGDGTAASTNLAAFMPGAAEFVREARSAREAFSHLARAGKLHAVSVAPRLCERLHHQRDAARLERKYIRGLNGDEFFFTKILRRQSVHLTQALLRTPLSPNQITLLSFLVSVVAAYAFLLGSYWGALAGAALYYFSTLLDCSDGEVARCTFRTSAFGCWLETVTDAGSTLLILAAVVAHVLTRTGHPVDKIAAVSAVAGTALLILLTSYQRRRVARADPNQYERIIHRRLGSPNAGPVGWFAVWGSQFIKRASVAHVILFLALIGQVRVLVYLWAFGATVALVIGTGVHTVIVASQRLERIPPSAGAALADRG